MKRCLPLLLCLCWLLSGCGVQPSQPEVMEPPQLEAYLEQVEHLAPVNRDYGETDGYTQLNDPELLVHVLYPTGELPQLEQAIEQWIDETVAYYTADVRESGLSQNEVAELNVDYNSFQQGDLVGVHLSGLYDQPHLAHPVDIAATFNADISTGKLLSLEDVLAPEGIAYVQDTVVERGHIEPELIDEHLLDNWLLTPTAMEILLVRGAYTPMSSGTTHYRFPYEDLQPWLLLPMGDAPAIPEPLPEEQQESPQPPVQQVQEIDPDKPMLALTFDDGPSRHTDRLLETFAQHGGKGTFFVVGNLIDSRPDTLRTMAEQGHEIAGHSWDHRQLTKLSPQEITDQLMLTRAKILDTTGVDSTIMRPPYGSSNETVREQAKAAGIALVNWSVDTLDWKHKDADKVYASIMADAKDGAIILCHDLHKTTVDAMERVIPDLLAQGYQLVTVSQLLTAEGETIQPGSLHFKQ